MPRKVVVWRTNVALLTVIVLGILVVVNFLSYRHHKRFDVTASKKYSLSDQTIKVLEGLEGELKIVVFDKPGSMSRQKAEDLLAAYKYRCPGLEVEYVDPDQRPQLAQELGVRQYGTLALEYGGRRKTVEEVSEEELTNAIIQLTKARAKKVYFLEGHGERDITSVEKEGYSLVKKALEAEGMEVDTVLLLRAEGVPEDCDVLVVAGPKSDLLEPERKAIAEYINRGGKALFMVDPAPGAGLVDFLAQWGVKVGDDVVIDTMSRLFAGDYFVPVITMYTDHPITRDFDLASFLPVCRSVSPADKVPEGLTVQSLGSTSNQHSWAETKVSGPYEFNQDEDVEGPVSVAVAVAIKPEGKPEKGETEGEEKPAKSREGRLVVFGDSDFASNAYINLSGNRDWFLNAVSWLAEEEKLISIRPHTDIARTLSLTVGQMQTIFYLTVVVMPLITLVVGVTVWWRRRRL